MDSYKVIIGDISRIECDAVVNAANNHLWMGSGVAGALKRRGGASIEREAVSKGPIPVGSAIETAAGGLDARWVIHGAVMGQDLSTDLGKVERTAGSCMVKALEIGAGSIAFPALGCGVGGMDPYKAASAMKKGIEDALQGKINRPDILLVVYDQMTYDAFIRIFGK